MIVQDLLLLVLKFWATSHLTILSLVTYFSHILQKGFSDMYLKAKNKSLYHLLPWLKVKVCMQQTKLIYKFLREIITTLLPP